MLTRSTIVLITAAILSSTSVVIGAEDPESKIGDRYPSLTTLEQQLRTNNEVTMRYSGPISHRPAWLRRLPQEEGDSKIADRYPLLEPVYLPISAQAQRQLGSYVMPRRAAWLNRQMPEEPEYRIADRYPLLEPQITVGTGSIQRVAAAASSRPARVRRTIARAHTADFHGSAAKN